MQPVNPANPDGLRLARTVAQGALAGRRELDGARVGPSRRPTEREADARSYVKGIEKRIILIDGRELARLMFEFGVGVTPTGPPYVLKRVDIDFFDDV